ncbi:YqzE family protein [Cohnella thermotolerans]|uniref:YqzE family protein n=1 Tax=Cohnella thermotolerans TaxID=329858 RepID=UPI0003FF2A73|nr:YqzE family protein [Cohnella thermotolerans]
MGDGTDLLKYVTSRAVAYLTTPPDVREKDAKPNRLPWTTQWFGMVPMGMQLWWDERRSNSPKRKNELESEL